MDEFELLDKLKKGLLDVINPTDAQKLFGRRNAKSKKEKEYYLLDLKSNLYKLTIPEFKLGKDPDAVRSSAAMIYNTIYSGKLIIDNKQFEGFSKDGFSIYELPFAAIKDDKDSTHTAQLDAGLISENGQDLILFEAKCMEWMSSPKGLKKAYFNEDRYICKESANIFIPIFDELVYKDKFKKDNGVYVHKPKVYLRYDAIQMMIHCLGIYNWCLLNSGKAKTGLKTIRLINLVWDCKGRKEYEEEEQQGEKFAQYATSCLKEHFGKMNIDFLVEYLRYSEFLKRVDWTNDIEHRNYLKRYEVY